MFEKKAPREPAAFRKLNSHIPATSEDTHPMTLSLATETLEMPPTTLKLPPITLTITEVVETIEETLNPPYKLNFEDSYENSTEDSSVEHRTPIALSLPAHIPTEIISTTTPSTNTITHPITNVAPVKPKGPVAPPKPARMFQDHTTPTTRSNSQNIPQPTPLSVSIPKLQSLTQSPRPADLSQITKTWVELGDPLTDGFKEASELIEKSMKSHPELTKQLSQVHDAIMYGANSSRKWTFKWLR